MKLEICSICGRQVISSVDEVFINEHEECLQEVAKKLDQIQKRNRRKSFKQKSWYFKIFLIVRKLFLR